MSISEDENFRNWFFHKIKDNYCTVVFEDLRGEIRTIECAPLTTALTEDNLLKVEENLPTKTNQIIWDIKDNAWKSFRWDTLISYNFNEEIT